MVRNDIKNSSLLKTKFLIYAFNGRTFYVIKRDLIIRTFLVMWCIPSSVSRWLRYAAEQSNSSSVNLLNKATTLPK